MSYAVLLPGEDVEDIAHQYFWPVEPFVHSCTEEKGNE